MHTLAAVLCYAQIGYSTLSICLPVNLFYPPLCQYLAIEMLQLQFQCLDSTSVFDFFRKICSYSYRMPLVYATPSTPTNVLW